MDARVAVDSDIVRVQCGSRERIIKFTLPYLYHVQHGFLHTVVRIQYNNIKQGDFYVTAGGWVVQYCQF